MTAKPKVSYRTITVKPTDPEEDAEVVQQAIITWDKFEWATFDTYRDELHISYTAETRKELLAFLTMLGKTLWS